jgi:hypothetical protein
VGGGELTGNRIQLQHLISQHRERRERLRRLE